MEDISKILTEMEKDVKLHRNELNVLIPTIVGPLGLLWQVLRPALTGRALSGPKEFTKRTLLARCITDLTTAVFLAKHHHFIQSLTVARPIIESLNLVELAEKDPAYITHWIKNEWKEIGPAKVRKLLNLKEDEFYSYLSNIASHPMWGMTRGMVSMSQSEDRRVAHVSIGPFTDDPLSTNQLHFTFGCLLALLADLIFISSKYYLDPSGSKPLYKLTSGVFQLFERRFISDKHLGKHKIFVSKFEEIKIKLKT